MKQIVLLLILFPALSFGQSKKELREQIVSLQLDSANQAELISDQQETIYELEQTIISQTRTLREAQNDIATMYSRISELNKQLKESEESISTLENEVFNLTLEKEMLQVQLDSALNRLNYYELNSYRNQGPFDFKYDYENGNGFNPPVMYPIGWSSDGKIAYKLDVESIGYGGAVSTHIIVEDLSNDEEIETLDVSLTGSPELGSDLVYDYNGNSDLVWLEEDFVKAVADIIEKHKIIPLGFGQLNPSNHIERPGPIGVDIYIALEKSDDRYRIFDDGNYHQPITSGSLESYPVDGEIFFCKPDIEYVGHIVSPIGNYAAIIMMHKYPCQWEGEITYYAEFIGIKLD